MDFMDLREGKKILTCYQTGNKHATSIMEKLKKKVKNKIFTHLFLGVTFLDGLVTLG